MHTRQPKLGAHYQHTSTIVNASVHLHSLIYARTHIRTQSTHLYTRAIAYTRTNMQIRCPLHTPKPKIRTLLHPVNTDVPTKKGWYAHTHTYARSHKRTYTSKTRKCKCSNSRTLIHSHTHVQTHLDMCAHTNASSHKRTADAKTSVRIIAPATEISQATRQIGANLNNVNRVNTNVH